MVYGVETIVEGEVVEQRICEVPGKVVLGRDVAPVMLQHVERQDAVLCIELRDQREPDPTAPVQQDQHAHGAEDCHLLNPSLLHNGPVQTRLSSEIQLIIIASCQNDVPEEQEAIQEMPAVANLGSAH